jgi:hypothetical protein
MDDNILENSRCKMVTREAAMPLAENYCRLFGDVLEIIEVNMNSDMIVNSSCRVLFRKFSRLCK